MTLTSVEESRHHSLSMASSLTTILDATTSRESCPSSHSSSGTMDSLWLTQSTLTRTSSELLPSSPRFATRQAWPDRASKTHADVNWLVYSRTGVRRLARETLLMENSGLRLSTGCKKFVATAQTTQAVTIFRVAGLALPTQKLKASSTMVEGPSNSHGTTITECSPTFSPLAHTTVNFTCSSSPRLCMKTETWR